MKGIDGNEQISKTDIIQKNTAINLFWNIDDN